MVKYLVISFLFLTSIAKAGFLVGLSTNTWQEKLPIVVPTTSGNVESNALTSFSSFGLGLGYDYLFTNRIRYALAGSYMSGKADIHKVDKAISPRRNFNSTWLTNKVHWRVTKSFSLGPSVVVNFRKIDDLDLATSTGVFLDMDYDLTDDFRLTQSLGTMSDSQQLAYSFILNRKF